MNQAILINHGILSIIFDLISDKLNVQKNLGSSQLSAQAGKGQTPIEDFSPEITENLNNPESLNIPSSTGEIAGQANVLLRKCLILLMFLANNNPFVQQRIFERLDLLMQLKGLILIFS